MTITVYNKATILHEIERLEQCLVLERVVREKVEQFKHRKQVNKTFTDAFKDTDFHAWIYKDDFKTSLTVRRNKSSPSDGIEFYVTAYRGESLTWDKIIYEFKRYSYEACLKQNQDRLEVLDTEIENFQQLYDLIKKMEYKCFNLSSIKYEMENALYIAKKDKVIL